MAGSRRHAAPASATATRWARRWRHGAWAIALALLLPLAAGSARAEPSETLQLMLGGRLTAVDFYLPQLRQPPRGAVILVHGFTRSRATLAEHAQAIAAQGLLAVVPDLPYVTDSRANARALRQLLAEIRAGRDSVAVQRLVLVGFSAGGLAALLAADAPGVVGYVGLDPFDRPSGIGRDMATSLRTPVVLIRAPASACNAYSIAEPWTRVLPQLERDLVLPGASHCDFEAPSDWLCRLVCGATDETQQRKVREALLQAIDRWLPRAVGVVAPPSP